MRTALMDVTVKLHATRSAKLSSVLLILDLSSAFDTNQSQDSLVHWNYLPGGSVMSGEVEGIHIGSIKTFYWSHKAQ